MPQLYFTLRPGNIATLLDVATVTVNTPCVIESNSRYNESPVLHRTIPTCGNQQVQ